MFPLTAHVFQCITLYTASQIRLLKSWPYLRDFTLADPNLASQQPIHLVIETDLYRSLLLSDLHQSPLGIPTPL